MTYQPHHCEDVRLKPVATQALAPVRERPILFQGAMVRAILAGTKTQTRRAIKYTARRPIDFLGGGGKDGPDWNDPSCWGYETSEGGEWVVLRRDNRDPETYALPCPYGRPGDRLWVREAFMHEPADYCWEASVSIPSRPASTVYRADYPNSQPGEGWKPSIHMPRNLSRIDLEITEVRVERLQAITDADAVAEGVEDTAQLGACFVDESVRTWRDYTDPERLACKSAAVSYRTLWERINGPGSWDANPWVWAVSFKRVEVAKP